MQTQEPGTALRRWVRRVEVTSWILWLALLFALSMLGRWGKEHWLLDLAANFQPQYFLAALISLLLALARRRWQLASVALALAFGNAWLVFNWAPRPAEATGTPDLRLFHLNVYSRNENVPAVETLLAETQPDIIALHEVTAPWLELAERLAEAYPHQLRQRIGNGSTLLLSRYPATKITGRYAGYSALPCLIEPPGQPALTLLVQHPPSPKTARDWQWRNDALMTAARFIDETPGPVLVMGDLNVTPWSPWFEHYRREAGLVTPGTRFFPRATWIFSQPLLGIPIDHFLLKGDLRARREWTGPQVGSDHYPILLEVDW